MSAEAELARIGQALLEPGAPALLRCPALEKPAYPGRVFVAARHDVASAILCDTARFSLRHYDDLLEQVLPGTRYLVGENDAKRQVRLRLLHAAQGWLDAQRGANAGDVPPNLAPAFRNWIGAMAREEAERVLDRLTRRAHGAAPINFVREYAFLIAWRIARRIIGVPAPHRVPLPVRLVAALRNISRPGPWLRLQGEQGASLTMLLMLQPLFGHVFGTVTTSPGWMQWLSRQMAQPSLAAIDRAFDLPGVAPAHSLLAALAAVEPQFAEVADYRLQARSLIFELTGAMVLIVGKSLAEIAGFAASAQGAEAGLDWITLVTHLSARDHGWARRDAAVNEALRLVGGSRLMRTVRHDGTWRAISLAAQDRVVVLTDAASRDPAAFADPGRFAPDPARPYITSGPLEGPHVCYGRGMAWTIMAEAIAATAGRIVPAPDARLTNFAGLPDDLPFTALYQ
ncbi:MAG: hypothetical protein ACK4UL_03760 [Novosphingobium meiothermophilum]|uniref:hypothetical protein n=1 Tax=Novosphingobium TaxID=165696 RepID=UPI000D6EA4E1|nr:MULTISPECIES: hypothetical protein [Novosphingobium]